MRASALFGRAVVVGVEGNEDDVDVAGLSGCFADAAVHACSSKVAA